MPLLFSYGTLRRDEVQMSVFGRHVTVRTDALPGFERGTVLIEGTEEANIRPSGNEANRVDGVLLDITDEELARADAYELPYGYKRIAVTLASGTTAWVYVHSAATFRDATQADAEAIIDFQLAMAHETEDVSLDRAIVTRGVHAVFRDPSHGRYFVAEEGGRVAASLLITYEWSDWRDGVVWWIQSVYVRPELRGKRIYAGLYDHVRSIAVADPHVRGIRLYVDKRNLPAQQVYSRLGMNGEHYLVFEWMK